MVDEWLHVWTQRFLKKNGGPDNLSLGIFLTMVKCSIFQMHTSCCSLGGLDLIVRSKKSLTLLGLSVAHWLVGALLTIVLCGCC